MSDRIKVPLHRLHEVASFFPHYRLEAPPAVDIRVCRDMACNLHGAHRCAQMLSTVAGEINGDRVKVGGVSCLGQCDHAPAVMINDCVFFDKTDEELQDLVSSALAGNHLKIDHADCSPMGWKIDCYNGQPKYTVVRQFIDAWKADKDGDLAARRKRVSQPILKALDEGKLRGMGGAGFPTARKWSTVQERVSDVKYIVCNGDESEPGTFKDRELLRRAPHLVIEGLILAGLVTGATQGYLYIRHEYEQEIEVLQSAVDAAREQGICGDNVLGSGQTMKVEIFKSPGGYICGEETALLEAMEDRRAEPRNKPPFPTDAGLRGKPTVINNVETLSWVPSLVLNGGKWYLDQGVNGFTGLRFVSISGDVNRPGVYEVPLGQTVRDLVMGLAGGMSGGQKLHAIATSGPSGGFLPAVMPVSQAHPKFIEGLVSRKFLAADAKQLDILDVPLAFDTLQPFPDYMLGAAFVVYGNKANMCEQALNCVEFYRNESCGKCVPCRMGTQKLVEMLTDICQRRKQHDLGLVDELSETMFLTSICGLGQVASNPIRTVLRFFRKDLEMFVGAR